MAKKFRHLDDGEWSNAARQRQNGMHLHKIKCCDCGLVHLVQSKVTTRGLRFRAWRLPK